MSSPTSVLHARSSLDTIMADHQRFIASEGDINNDAKYYNNCINEPFFNIPLSQVLQCVHVINAVKKSIS